MDRSSVSRLVLLDGSEIAPRLTSPLLLPPPLLLPLRFCCCYSVTAVCRFSSAVFLGAPPLLNCYCADTPITMHATNDLSSSLPLLSFVTSFAVSTHLHDSSDSSYQLFNLMPRLSPSGHILQPQNLNSTCQIFPRPLLDAIALAALE